MKGKKNILIFLFPIVLLAFLSSCEDCYKCGIDQQEPYFNVKFFNARHLHSLNDSLLVIDQKSKENSAFLLQSNRFLNQSLDSLEGEKDPIVINSLEFKIDSVTLLIDSLNKSTNGFNAIKTKLNQARKKIESGAVPLESITSPEGRKIAFVSEDSLAAYKFPLSMNDAFAKYFIKINDSTYSLEVSYTTHQVVEDGSVIIKANNLSLLNTSNFDSTKMYYRNDLRKTDETHLYLYF